VLNIERDTSAGYTLSVCDSAMGRPGTPADLEFDAVVVCSGLHVTPLVADIRGLEHFRGDVMHSVQYKTRKQACHYMIQPLVELYGGCMVVLKVS
jgi:hypothetical protein